MGALMRPGWWRRREADDSLDALLERAHKHRETVRGAPVETMQETSNLEKGAA